MRALTDTFEAQVTQLFTGYVGALLQVGRGASTFTSSLCLGVLTAAWAWDLGFLLIGI